MSYGAAAALQAAIYQRLTTDQTLNALVGDAIFDMPPQGELPTTYVSLGPEEVRDASDKTGSGALHRVTISVVSDAEGFATVKAAAAAISDALTGDMLTLSRGRLIGLWFDRAKARRVGFDDRRRVDLRFSARIEDN
ncbi:hypothetical protein RGUI_0314 [Rhodovulum sp. P5]|uniref:DUF3168 domain-containing protein n=1 Tax=Rhodovulum sp. P5 TaxID=1564506 RepID=UPI0009C2B537|nr:DUF3168 domain-containing protein [Rhodovulum sp. P5]ARE38455.1 hypothetical protein RGUI_0314 [Rhodovulum sp. P5]